MPTRLLGTAAVIVAVALAAAAVRFAAGDGGSSGGSASETTVDGVLIRANGLLIREGAKPTELCVKEVQLSRPPHCDGFRVDGVEPEDLPGVEQSGDVSWTDSVILEGVLDDDRVLHVTGTPEIGYLERPWLNWDPEVPAATCSQSPGVVSAHPIRALTFRDMVRDRYPDTFVTGWLDPDGVLVMTFIDGPGAYEREFRSRFDGAFCVERAPMSEKNCSR
jgi:hypothetical protein